MTIRTENSLIKLKSSAKDFRGPAQERIIKGQTWEFFDTEYVLRKQKSTGFYKVLGAWGQSANGERKFFTLKTIKKSMPAWIGLTVGASGPEWYLVHHREGLRGDVAVENRIYNVAFVQIFPATFYGVEKRRRMQISKRLYAKTRRLVKEQRKLEIAEVLENEKGIKIKNPHLVHYRLTERSIIAEGELNKRFLAIKTPLTKQSRERIKKEGMAFARKVVKLRQKTQLQELNEKIMSL